jgi:hypothetical protein
MRTRGPLIGAALAVGAVIAADRSLRRHYETWGATLDDVRRAMPGDDIVPDPARVSTRSVAIHAPPDQVWPWLVQIGHGRGGLYSYDWLENVIGCDLHSADTILAEHQQLEPGALIRMGPEGYPCFVVVEVDTDHHLVLQSADPATGRPPSDLSTNASWQWLLEPHRGATRLVSRQRLAYPRLQAPLWAALQPVTFAMERKMLLGIKARSEAGGQAGTISQLFLTSKSSAEASQSETPDPQSM